MFGWFRPRRVAPSSEPMPFEHLRPGRRYRVMQAFIDHDRVHHPVDETWMFLRSIFPPYEGRLSLLVATSDGIERRINLKRRREDKSPIADALYTYVLPVPDKAGSRPLLLTRDSVCMGDDVTYPHALTLDIEDDADAAAIASAILDARYLACVGLNATWSLVVGPDRVFFGYEDGTRFVKPVGSRPLTARAKTVDRLHVTDLAQADPAQLCSDFLGGSAAEEKQ